MDKEVVYLEPQTVHGNDLEYHVAAHAPFPC